jgi:hypothetical protein
VVFNGVLCVARRATRGAHRDAHDAIALAKTREPSDVDIINISGLKDPTKDQKDPTKGQKNPTKDQKDPKKGQKNPTKD